MFGNFALKKYLPWIITGLVFLGFYLIGKAIPEEAIRKLIKDTGPFGVVIFILLALTTYVIAPLSSTPFLFAGFYAYGQKVVVYTFIAAFISSITNFLIAKKWGRSLAERLTSKESLQKVDSLIKNHGFFTVFVLRLLLGSFHDVLSYAFGLTSIRFATYLTASTLGIIPSSIIWYVVSAWIKSPLTFVLLHIGIAYLLLMIYLIWKYLRKRW